MSVKIIDVDPDVLQKTSQAALHAAKQSWAHLNAELVFETVGEVDSVMATLVDDEPYSFISGGSEGEMVAVGQSFKPGVAITREAVFKHYSWVHGTYSIDAFDPLLEIRGDWYTYFESLTTLGDKASGETIKMVNLVLLASGAGRGITGEISWTVDPEATRAAAKAAGTSLEQQRWQRVVQHDRYLQGLRDGDVDGIVDLLGHDAQSIIRDYVNDTGALINLDGRDAHQNFTGHCLRCMTYVARTSCIDFHRIPTCSQKLGSAPVRAMEPKQEVTSPSTPRNGSRTEMTVLLYVWGMEPIRPRF